MWANPGDEIKSPSNVASGKWYYIKGLYTSSGTEYTIYYSIPSAEEKEGGKPAGEDAAALSISDATPVLFTKVTGGWTIKSPNGFYIRPHSSNGQTYLQTDEYILTLANGTTKEGANKGVKIGTYTSGTKTYYIQANKTSRRLGGYTNTQWDVTLVEAYAPASFAAGKTMISFSNAKQALDLTTANLPSGLAAYKVTAADASSVTLTAVNSAVEKNTGIILTGTAGTTYNIPVVGTGTDISASNLLVASDGTSNVTDAYVLSDGKFHPVADAGLVIPAGKAYLPKGSLSAHELGITFDNGDVTGIADVRAKMEDFKGEFFNLSGQRVAQPTKGLYIVNGKKVIIK